MRLFWMELSSLLMKHNRSVNRKVIFKGKNYYFGVDFIFTDMLLRWSVPKEKNTITQLWSQIYYYLDIT